jgi:hypothetical protein
MRVMGAQQQQPTYAHIPQGYYLPHAGDGLQQQQQQQKQQQHQQQPYVFAAPPSHYPYDQSQPQHQQLPFMPPPSYSNPPPPYGYPPQYPVEEPFVPADPNSRNEFFFATAGRMKNDALLALLLLPSLRAIQPLTLLRIRPRLLPSHRMVHWMALLPVNSSRLIAPFFFASCPSPPTMTSVPRNVAPARWRALLSPASASAW